ncbi:MAG: hypothetical protein ABI231_05990 [Candidatus Tumulicola sp.]
MTPEYESELADAERQGRAAHDAMNAWLDRPIDAPNDTPAAVLEGYAETLRRSRRRIEALIERHGEQSDLTSALDRSTQAHERLGLKILET